MRFTPLKRARLERGLLQIEVAQLAGIDHCRLSLYENGHRQPKTEELTRLARVLGVSVQMLVDTSTQAGEAA